MILEGWRGGGAGGVWGPSSCCGEGSAKEVVSLSVTISFFQVSSLPVIVGLTDIDLLFTLLLGATTITCLYNSVKRLL